MPWYLSFQILELPQRLLGQRPGVAADTVAQLRERILQRGRGRALRGKALHQTEPGLCIAQRGVRTADVVPHALTRNAAAGGDLRQRELLIFTEWG